MTFKVIDKKTGKEADTYKIALKEDWAKHLIYCDMEGFAIEEDGTLVLMDECGNVAYCPDDRFEIVFEKEEPQGEWVYRQEWFEGEKEPRMAWGCNQCGFSIKSVHEKRNFCPNCGVKMQKGETQ